MTIHIPSTPYDINTHIVPSFGGRGSVFADQQGNGEGHNIYCQRFWKIGETLSDCRWEQWFRPELYGGTTPYTGYSLTGGESGLHEMMMGVACGIDSSAISGNMHPPGTMFNDFNSLDRWGTSEFAHIQVGSIAATGKMYTWVYGVLSNILPMDAPRESYGQPVFLFGSDHNGAAGYHYGARGYEGLGSMDAYRHNFTPDHWFQADKISFDGLTVERSDFCVMTDYDTGTFIDTSRGYETVSGVGRMPHSGVLNIGKNLPYRASGHWPIFVAGVVPEPPVWFPTPTAVPSGALWGDNFDRTPVVHAWAGAGIEDNLYLGTLPFSTIGTLLWGHSSGTGGGGWGIIGGRAYSNYQSTEYNKFTTDRTNLLQTVKRIPNSITQTGLCARYIDSNNCIYAHMTPTNVSLINRTGGTQTQTVVSTSNHEKLGLNVNGTLAKIYADDVEIGSLAVTANGSFDHGLWGNTQLDDIYRFDEYYAFAAL